MTLEQIEKLVTSENIKIVSFDIFDTLLVRPCMVPTDMFKIIAIRANIDLSFMEIRKLAEQYARDKKPFYEDDITLDDIYEQLFLKFNFTKEECDRIKAIELEVEEDYLYPKNSMQEIFSKALEHGKKIIITSDMYLPKSFLEKILKKNNYIGYDELFVSGEIKLSKGSGRLYEFIIDKYTKEGVGKRSIVHIGDNQRADVYIPKSKGIQSVRIVSSSDRIDMLHLMQSIWYRRLKFTDNRFILGFFANQVYDNTSRPYDKNTMFNGELDNFTDLLLTPIFYSFTNWMLNDCIKNNIDTLLLVYRDGYLIEKILNIILKDKKININIKPLRLSRKALYVFDGLSKEKAIERLLFTPAHRDISIKEFLQLRLLMSDEQISEVENNYDIVMDNCVGDVKNQVSLMEQFYEYFLNNSKEKAQTIKDYCKENIKNGKNIAVFDVGYSGRVNAFLKDTFNINSIAYHMFKDFSLKNEDDIKSYFDFSNTFYQSIYVIHNQIFEDILSENVGTLKEIVKQNDEFCFILDENYESQEKLLQIQNRILDNIQRFHTFFKKDIDSLNINGLDFYHSLKDFLLRPTSKDMNVLKDLYFIDNFIINDKNNGYDRWFATKRSSVKNPNDYCTIRKIIKRHYKKAKNFYDKYIKEKLENAKKTKAFQSKIEDFFKHLQNCFNEAKITQKDYLFIGHFAYFDKGVCKFISDVAYKKSSLIVSTTPWLKNDFVQNKLNISSIIVPKATFLRGYDKNVSLKITSLEKNFLKEHKKLQDICERMKLQFKDMGKNYAEKMVIFLYKYFSILLEKTQPKKVFIWNKFNATHEIFYLACVDKKIQSIFMEFGVLPGTFNFDLEGQMGESFIANNTPKFNALMIDNNDLSKAAKVLNHIRETKLSRNLQPQNNIVENIKSKINTQKPTILYFEQNDFEAGLIPYDDHVKKFHSPWSIDSKQACEELSKICKKNDWNFIYKPHPNLEWMKFEREGIDAKNANMQDLIDIADVVVTILSQSSYEALIRNKPVVMLGFTHLKDKQCTYEAFEKDKVEDVIKLAIRDGFTPKMRTNFQDHVARLLKYYLYDDNNKRALRYGKSIEEFKNEFL